MTARVLIVDDMLANLKLLEARLVAEYFEVRTANNGAAALELCERDLPDVILLDVMMPGMDGFEVCRRLKSDVRTQDIPVVMVTALDSQSDLLKGLEAGADDFLTKPVDELALITRVKNLARLKLLTDEMLMRASTEEQMGFAAAMGGEVVGTGRSGQVLLVEDRDAPASRIIEALKADNDVVHLTDTARALLGAPDGNYDLLIVSLNLENADGLRLCSQLRSIDRTRHLPIMIVVEPASRTRYGRQRLHRASRQHERTSRAGAHPGEAETLHGLPSLAAGADRGVGGARSAHGASQPALSEQSPGHAFRRVSRSRPCSIGPADRCRSLQGDQRHART
jgi:two-component system cell cycle response regulator